MIDTHAHLNIDEFDNKIEDVLKLAKNNGVDKVFVIGMDLKTSQKAVELSNKYKNLYATVGIHPSYVDNSNHKKLDYLYKEEKVIAVGEIGLDYYWRTDNYKVQEKVFIEQIEKAIKLNLPVIIHTRNSFDETYNIVEKYKGKLKGVFHCFSSTYEDAKKVIDLGFYIGIDGPITFKNNNEELIRIVKNIPLNKILIETDSPYLTPVPFRGKRNEPKNLKYIAEKIAEIKEVKLQEVIKQTTENAVELFKLGEFK